MNKKLDKLQDYLISIRRSSVSDRDRGCDILTGFDGRRTEGQTCVVELRVG